MRKKLPKILITGACGFIGSEFVRQLIMGGRSQKGHPSKCEAIIVDKLTYAADLLRLKAINGRFKFYKADICNAGRLEEIFQQEKPKIVV
ncbi:MAG: GDP-mannose 4,6-dehydratase, partial [Candidatus Omnitrophica bacterium]|nr:GDP-mannose 4,6-dehydratase [Candidatus Omnitrophota bacterium]